MQVYGFTVSENAEVVKGNNPAHGFQNRTEVNYDAIGSKFDIAVWQSGLHRKPFPDIGRCFGNKHSARTNAAHFNAGNQTERWSNRLVDLGLHFGIVVRDVAEHVD